MKPEDLEINVAMQISKPINEVFEASYVNIIFWYDLLLFTLYKLITKKLKALAPKVM